MARLIREKDWSESAVGPVDTWPQSLRTTISTCLNSRFPILIWWGPELVMLYNDAYRPILGTKHPHSLGNRGMDVWPEVWDIIGPMLTGVLARGEATWSENQMLPLNRHGYEEECYFTFSYSPVYDESGGIGGVFCAVTETTAMVLAERQMRELDRAKTEFFSNISHEFRTPLTLIMGPLEDQLRQAEGALPAPLLESLSMMHRNGLRLQKLVNNLLDFSRIEAGRMQLNPRPLDLAALTADLASQFRAALEGAGLSLHVSVQPLPRPVWVDREMWEKVVLNLLSNAYKYTWSGSVTVTLTPVTGGVELRVTDTGVGIPADEQPRLFERFHRVTGSHGRTHEGSGIGLSLIRELVLLQGGTIGVESEPGRGSTFRVLLPYGEAVDSAVTEPAPPGTDGLVQPFLSEVSRQATEPNLSWTNTSIVSVPTGDRARVLLADDNADMRSYIHQLLEPHYDVVAVADGQAAIETLRESLPDLVLTDIMMPRLDGFGLLQHLKATAETALIPVMLLSARAGEEARIDGYTAGADDYLSKPFSASELLTRVRAQLQQAKLRQEARQQLAENASRLHGFFEHAPVAIGILRGPEFVVELANPMICEIWNRRLDQLMGQPIFQVLPEATGQGFEELLTGVLETGIPFKGLELPVTLLRSGEPQTVFVSLVYEPLREPGTDRVSSIIVVATEVTESVRARQQIEASERKIQTLLRQAPVAVAILRGRNFVVELANERHLEFWGRPLAEVTGRPVFEVIPEAAGQGYEAILLKVLETGVPYVANEQYVELNRNGQREGIWVNVVYEPLREEDTGQVTGLMEVIHEVTGQVQARQLIQASEQRFHTLANSIDQLAWLADAGGWIYWYNERWYAYTGTTLEQMQGWGWQAVHHPDHLERVVEFVKVAWGAGEPFELTFPLRSQAGSYRWFLTRAYPVKDETGKVTQWVGTNTDIHEQKTMADQLEHLVMERTELLRQANSDLERSNLDLMQFASVASHDLKEPLRKIQTFGTRLEEVLAGRLSAEETDLFRRMIASTARMQTLVGDVLRLSKLSDQTASFEPVDLNAVLGQIREDLELTIREQRADLQSANLPVVLAAPGQMHQLLLNLITNALKFQGNGQPQIRIKQVPLTDEVAKALGLPTLKYTVISVSDNGIGFDPKYKDKIFGMFQRLHGRSQYAGTGIGLTIVKKIIENHRGYIDVQSEPGRGTTFRVALPVRY